MCVATRAKRPRREGARKGRGRQGWRGEQGAKGRRRTTAAAGESIIDSLVMVATWWRGGACAGVFGVSVSGGMVGGRDW